MPGSTSSKSANLFDMNISTLHSLSKASCLAGVLALALCVPGLCFMLNRLPQTAQATPEVPGLGAAQAAEPQAVCSAGGFSSANEEFRHADRNFHRPVRCRWPACAGSASYDASTKQYTINSAGYNIWYNARRVPVPVEEDVRGSVVRSGREVSGGSGSSTRSQGGAGDSAESRR